MKYTLIAILTVTIIVVSLKAQNMSIFLKATNSGWYPEFLKPVVKTVAVNSESKKILDIGTGPGTLPQMLINEDSSLQITGIDIDTAMIDKARRQLVHKNVSFDYEKINAPLAFVDNEFDTIINPTILFEILSPSTEEYDRTIKFEFYKK